MINNIRFPHDNVRKRNGTEQTFTLNLPYLTGNYSHMVPLSSGYYGAVV